MKKILVVLAMLVLPSAARAELKIVTTTPDFADIAREIGGNHVEVHSVMKGPENIHNVIPKPTEMVYLNQADLLANSGVDAEPWLDNLVAGARNPKVERNHPGFVDMSDGLTIKDAPTGHIDRSMGDVHAYGNPHYTLNPQVAQRLTVTLVKAMAKADPANAQFYVANAQRLVKELGAVAKQIRGEFKPYDGLKVVTFHAAWDYFADAIPIQIVGTIEPKPGITPSPAQVQQTIDMMKRVGAKVVICETWDDVRLAQYVADQSGAKMVVLPDHVNGVAGVDTYAKLFEYDTQKLIETARAAGVQPK
jgi:zinc/manganese transport system substrate-binding protein